MTIVAMLMAFVTLLPLCAQGQTPVPSESQAQPPAQSTSPLAPPEPSIPPPMPPPKRKETAAEQLDKQKHQRILGIIPEFNSSNIANAEPLNPKQKLSLAFKSATDPFAIGFAALDAGISQGDDGFAEYGQGVAGYAKRFAASYADSFDGAVLGNAVLPILFHEDPRYFRKGTGTFRSRFLYSMISTVRARSDAGRWVPNYGNVLGNLAAGGISNLYYPASDRGADLTIERALTVTFQGAIGAFAYEFWPDLQHRMQARKARKAKP